MADKKKKDNLAPLREALEHMGDPPKPSAVDCLFGLAEPTLGAKTETVHEIAPDKLHPFKNHPYHVTDNDELRDLAKSIAENGVLTPLVARPRKDGGFELLSGHRRKAAAESAGLKKLPVIVRELDDDTATVFMVDSNKQRENQLPSEKAFSYKMKLEALKRLAGRPKKNGDQVGHKNPSGRSIDLVAAENDDSRNQIQRYIRLTFLIPELLKLVDEKRIAFNPAVELSYLSKGEQRALLAAIECEDCTPSHAQAIELKKKSQEGALAESDIGAILSRPKPNQVEHYKFNREDIRRYFPQSYTDEQIHEAVFKALEAMKKQRERSQDAR